MSNNIKLIGIGSLIAFSTLMAIFNLLFTVILIFSSVTDRKAKIID